MTRETFLHQRSTYPLASLCPSLPLTPASLLYKDKKLLNFCSRDYLGLSQHVELRKSAIKYVLHYGTGICDPEIKTGFLECQRQIEEKCAESVGFSRAHLFSTHSAALDSILQHFAYRDWTVFVDAGYQTSLLKAIQRWGGKCILYPHAELRALDVLLSSSSTTKHLILSESLFAATGHISDIASLIHLSQKYDAFLIIDDSRAFGVKGKQGFGLVQRKKEVDFMLCALDCAVGASGAFAACSESISPYFFTTTPISRENTLSFSTLGAIEAALELIPTFEGERMQLEQRSHWFRQQLKAFNVALISSSSHLIAIACDTPADAHHRSNALLEQDILSEVSVIEQEKEEAYLLFNINTYHTPEELTSLTYACEQLFQSQQIINCDSFEIVHKAPYV